jgi:Tfp pilus assembly protein PilF
MTAPVLIVVTTLALAAAPRSPQQFIPPNPATERAAMHYRSGWDLLRHEDWPGASREFQAAIESDAKYTLAYYGLGRSYMPQRRYAEAIKAYITCREQYIARVSERFNSQQEADRMRQDELMGLREILRVNTSLPQTQSAQNVQRQIQNRMRQIQNSVDRQRTAISFDASVPAFVSVALGSAYFRAERFADAEREYKAAVDIDDQAGEAHNNLAVLYMVTGRLIEAETEMKLAERAGFRVSSDFKRDLAERRK